MVDYRWVEDSREEWCFTASGKYPANSTYDFTTYEAFFYRAVLCNLLRRLSSIWQFFGRHGSAWDNLGFLRTNELPTFYFARSQSALRSARSLLDLRSTNTMRTATPGALLTATQSVITVMVMRTGSVAKCILTFCVFSSKQGFACHTGACMLWIKLLTSHCGYAQHCICRWHKWALRHQWQKMVCKILQHEIMSCHYCYRSCALFIYTATVHSPHLYGLSFLTISTQTKDDKMQKEKDQ